MYVYQNSTKSGMTLQRIKRKDIKLNQKTYVTFRSDEIRPFKTGKFLLQMTFDLSENSEKVTTSHRVGIREWEIGSTFFLLFLLCSSARYIGPRFTVSFIFFL